MQALAILACAVLPAAVGAAPAPVARDAPPSLQIAEADVQELLRDAAVAALPEGAEVAAVHYRGGLAMRGAGLIVTVDPPAGPVTSGRVALRARVSTSLETRVLSFAVDVVAPSRGVLLRRGAAVLVTARSGAVTVTAEGEAQQDGAEGERIHVLCPELHRVVVARVIDASTVQIDLGGAR